MDLTTIIISGIAALVGSAISLFAAYLTHKWEIKKQKNNEERIIFGFLQALHDEVETIWEIYQKSAGSRLEVLNSGDPFLGYWPIASDYFTVFNSNAYLIGHIKDNDLRKEIVTTYTMAKGLVDLFRFNNELVGRYQQACSLFLETNQEIHKSQANAQHEMLSNYGSALKNSHDELKLKVNNLLRALRKKGVLYKD
jgi:hypothetical protein